jgi:hypothetical protein
MENHSECSDVAILENIVKDVKTADIFNEIEELISEMTEIIGKIICANSFITIWTPNFCWFRNMADITYTTERWRT